MKIANFIPTNASFYIKILLKPVDFQVDIKFNISSKMLNPYILLKILRIGKIDSNFKKNLVILFSQLDFFV